MNPIPRFAQSSVDPSKVSLTIESLGKAVAGLITFLGVLNVVDPIIANQAWGNFVASIITAIPVGYSVWNAGLALWGLIRKIAVRVFARAPIAQ